MLKKLFAFILFLTSPLAAQSTGGSFIEENGVLIMEAESADLPANWVRRTSVPPGDPDKIVGFTGNGFIEWTGAQFFGLQISPAQANGVIDYTFTINNPGVYRFRWRTKQKDAGQTFDAGNDTFVRYATGTNPPGAENFGTFTKVFIQDKNNWNLDVRAEPRMVNGQAVFVRNNFRRQFNAGTHTIQLAARSPGHVIDRLILHRDDVPFNANLFATAPESAREGANPPISPGESAALQTPSAGTYGELKQWHRVTTAFEGPNLSETGTPNPFNDYRLEVTFRHSSGEEITVPGYFAADGSSGETGASSGTIWRAHLRPWLTGAWTYTARFINGNGAALNNTGTEVSFSGENGSFAIGESDKLGTDLRQRGRLEYVNKHHLRFSGSGEYFLKYGADSPENFLAYQDIDNTPNSLSGERNTGSRHTWQPHVMDWRPGDPEWQDGKGRGAIGALNFLRKRGASSVSMLLYTTDGGDDGRTFPWINKNQKARFDCSKLDQWEILFEHANASGLNLTFKLAEEENWNDTTGNDLTRYYREMVARFGHHLALTWIISEEFGGFGVPAANEIQILRDRGTLMTDIDPWNNHLVTHTGPGRDPYRFYDNTVGEATFTGASLQIGAAATSSTVFDRTLLVRNLSAAAGRPWVVANDEQGPANRGILPDVAGNRTNVVWGHLMAGGAGLEYYVNRDADNYDSAIENWREIDHIWTWSELAINNFFLRHQIPFWDMQNEDDLLSATDNDTRCLALTGDTYVIYLRDGGSASLNLGGLPTVTTYDVKWYDPRNGGDLQNGSITSIQGGGFRALGNAPSSANSDWAILIRDTSNIPADLGPVDPSTYGNCPIILQMFARDFPVAGNNFYLDETPLLTDITNESALAINPANATQASTSMAFPGPAGTYDLVFRAVGENDGSSSFVLKINGETIGTHEPPLSLAVFEVDSRYQARFNNVTLAVGDTVTVEATIASINGEFSRGRWLGIDFLARCRGTGSIGNLPPRVNAGSNLTVLAATAPSFALLQGTLSDPSLPDGNSLTQTWSQLSGPGTVDFSNSSELRTLAAFSEPGSYRLRLTGSDGELTAFDDLTVTVTSDAPGGEMDFSPLADAYLQNGTLFNNAELRVESATNRTRLSYLKFDLSSLNGTPNGSQLRLTEGTDPSGGNMTLRFFPGTSNADWTETNLATNTPAKGAEFASWTGNLGDGGTVEIDTASLVSGPGVYTIIIEADSSPLDLGLSSREGASPPVLTVTQSASLPEVTFDFGGPLPNAGDPFSLSLTSSTPASSSELFLNGLSQGERTTSPFIWDLGSATAGDIELVTLTRLTTGQILSTTRTITIGEPTLPAPTIGAVSAGDDIIISWPQVNGATQYRVLSSTDLSLPLDQWEILATFTAASNPGSYEHTNIIETDDKRFYLLEIVR